MTVWALAKERSTIGSRWTSVKGHASGFDYLRICLAVSVLLWHSYQVSWGVSAAREVWATPLGLVIQLILPAFFALSGFLVAASIVRNPSLKIFLSLRFLRIFPALCVEVILSALILGPLVTSFSLTEYFSGRSFFTYFANIVGWIHYFLPGVFLENPYPEVVNTSLWTVPFELECYILISVVALLGLLKNCKYLPHAFIVCTFTVFVFNKYAGRSGINPGGVDGRVLVLCFFAGLMCFVYRDRLPLRSDYATIAFALAMALVRYDHLVYLAPFFAAYFTVYIGLLNPARTIVVNSGDYSYGTYLYAAPVQQTVVWIFEGHTSWTQNVAISLPATVIFALFSWHCVERPFLRLKSKVRSDKREAY